MSPSVTGKSSTEHRSSRQSIYGEKDRGSPPRRRERSPIASSRRIRSPSRRELSPARHKSSHKDRGGSSPPSERHSGQVKSPKREKMSFPVLRSPSPRTKRLRRSHAEKDVEKSSERDNERNHEKGNDKSKRDRSYREKDSEMEAPKDRRERMSERENERPRDRNRTRDREPDKDRERNVVEHTSSKSKLRRSESPSDLHHRRSRHHSRSPPSRSRARDEDEGSRGAEHGDGESDAVAQMKAAEQALETKDKQKPSFELSGKLADETNRVRGVTLLFNEPPDARKPDVRWRLYVFKGGEVLNEPLYVHRQSCYLFGRERRVADIPTDHPSCSKQHAVLQYRQVEVERPDGMMSKQIKPYLMDLGSTNKTFINEAPIEPQRYYELFEKDTIKFGNSSREYVLLHENSAN